MAVLKASKAIPKPPYPLKGRYSSQVFETQSFQHGVYIIYNS
jgi:hypothetical protein